MPDRRLKIAFFTPLLPVKSGISDYSEELLPDFAALADVDIVIDDGYTPITNSITERCGILRPSEFLARHGEYDIAIYQIANSFDHHAYMIPCMEACPGILVLHDFCLQYLVLGLTLRAGKFQSLIETLRPRHGSKAPSLARRIQLGIEDPNVHTFARPLIERSRAVIVHSQAAAEAVRQDCPDKPIRVIHMGVPIPDAQPASIRERFGLSTSDFVVASISTLSYTKRLDLLLEAFRGLHERHHDAKLLIVGGGSIGDRARRFISQSNLKQAVVCTGWVSIQDYEGLIGTSDVVVDMRYPSGAETSASMMRAIAAGRPAIVSDQGTFSELPDTFCRKIPVNAQEGTRLGELLEEMYNSPAQRQAMSAAANEWARANVQLSVAARRYADFAHKVATSTDTSVRPGPLFAKQDTNSPGNALLYKAARMTYLYRNYGLRDTLRRVSEEVLRKV